MAKPAKFTCRECGHKQTAKAALKAGARCSSKICRKTICVHCGCTEITACFVTQHQLLSHAPDYCYFIAPGVCSNPRCVELAYYTITDEDVRRAQAYYEGLAPQTPQTTPPPPSLFDLRRGVAISESDLAHIIINELLNEVSAHILSSADVDVFDLINGDYDAELTPLIREIFAAWNDIVGSEFFTCGESLLAAPTEGVYG